MVIREFMGIEGVIKGQRNSSVELFRILATFLVLIVHLNGWMAGGAFAVLYNTSYRSCVR